MANRLSSCVLLPLLLLLQSIAEAESKPNFIICQPDDFKFLERWTPPPHINSRDAQVFEGPPLPNIDWMRRNGVQMMEAYTASTMCGTSRYSTMTGRYPSRSAFGREINWGNDVSSVVIPETKLVDEEDVWDGRDCSRNNIAAILKRNGYRTGMTGKWHLTEIDPDDYDYDDLQDTIKDCGFDFAEAVYAENQWGDWHDGSFSHNMEYMTQQGIEFIKDSHDDDEPFLLYFNPTVPHNSADVYDALYWYDCRDTPKGRLSREPSVKGMTRGTDCETYRDTIWDRANGRSDNDYLGSIWLDDSIGALLQTLDDIGQLDNTFFLFQMDHGQEGKATIWESGARIAQFVYFPDYISPGTKFNGMVSTVDIVKTVLDYAGIDEDSPGYYESDGISWRPALESEQVAESWNDHRCIFVEMDRDRAVRCGCYKYMELDGGSTSFTWGNSVYDLDFETEVLFDLCDRRGRYETDDNQEEDDIKRSERDVREEMEDILECHLDRTRSDERPDFSSCGTSKAMLTPSSSSSSSSSARVKRLQLIDADSNRVIREIKDGDSIWQHGDGTRLSIRADTSGDVGSVRFSLDSVTDYWTESATPYALNGDVEGDYWPEPVLAEPGRHEIVATPFSRSGAGGSRGTPLSITIYVVTYWSPAMSPAEWSPAMSPAMSPTFYAGGRMAHDADEYLARLVLVNARNNKDIQEIHDGDVLDLDELPDELNIRAETVPETVGSVRFYLNGDRVRTESVAPYAMFSDNNGDYAPDPGYLTAGSKELTAIPYSKSGGGGTEYARLTVKFRIND